MSQTSTAASSMYCPRGHGFIVASTDHEVTSEEQEFLNEQESVSENQELESDKERGREGVGSDEVELAPNYLKNSLLWDTMLQGRSGKTFSYNCGTRRKEEDLPSIQTRKSGLYKAIDRTRCSKIPRICNP